MGRKAEKRPVLEATTQSLNSEKVTNNLISERLGKGENKLPVLKTVMMRQPDWRHYLLGRNICLDDAITGCKEPNVSLRTIPRSLQNVLRPEPAQG
jgi:hypothetical protein